MSKTKIENLMRMKEIATTKQDYGMNQIGKTTFSSKSALMNDSKAVNGKKVLREKIFSHV